MRFIALLLLLGAISKEQQIDFELKNLKFKGLEFSTTKEAIVGAVGQGRRIETNYECGFFSNDQEGGPYYQLMYANFNYIGSDKEKTFYLEHVNFDADGSIKLMYLKSELTGRTTVSEFAGLFGERAKEIVVELRDDNSILLYSKSSDDGAVFRFRNGRLFEFQYWTPC
ncbi:hypothetical protein WBG78_30445 [Chryseolinea sp. T2]|uniref:hypothetical protein n=1 Tax=Chryseolinea sp. T2 TaxID=3129255 RepID=UPI003077D569